MAENTINGNKKSNIIISGATDDQINAGGGNDLVISGAGDDTINGGAGCDIIISGSGDDVVNGGSGSDILITGSGDDTVNGGSGNDIIISGSGDDTVSGGSGNDLILSGSGDDVVSGGSGNDYINTGSGDDTASGGSGNDYIETGSGHDTAEGNGGNDVIITGTGDDTASGNGGHDIIITGTGNDTIYGNAGNDIIVSGDGNDIVDGGEGHDVILSGDGDDIVAGGSGDDVLITGYGSDTVNGGDGYDWIHAGADDDVITAGAGDDYVDGGTGNDVAIFEGNRSEYVIVTLDTSTYEVTRTATGEVDIVKNVELFSFDDVDIDPSNPTTNTDPTAVDDAVITDEDTAVTIDVLANDSDVDGDALTVVSATAANGSVTINPDGTLDYTPNANFNGADTISYEISDGNGGTSTASVSVTVNAVNDGPVAVDDAITTDEDTAVTIDVLANDSDVDNDTLTVVSATAVNGSVTLNSDGTLEYTPSANFNGADTISYEISDGNGGTSTASVAVTVNAVNDGPVATNDAVTTDEDTAITIDVLANDSDVDGDTLTVVSATAANGSVTINPDGTLDYTPNANFNGADTISYEISDGNGGTSTASVSVTVNAVNDGPVAVDDAITTDEDTAITIDVLANDSDVDGDALTVVSATAANGSVTINQDGTLEYTPNANFNGADTVSYEISDGNGGTATAEVSVTVSAVNDGPVAVDDAITTDEDTSVTIDVLANDSDIDGDALTVVSATAANGSVTINPDGTLDYTPNANFNGADTISYEISDGNGGTSTATVAVTVNAVNDGPVAVDDAVTTDEDTAITIDVLANDSDVDGDTLTVVSATAVNGSVTINPDGTLEYTPTANFNGADTISYEISDGNGGTSTATVAVTVNAVNDGPVAVDDAITTDEDTAVTLDVLANDSDIDGDTLTVVSATAANGSVTINPDGTLEYTPNANFNGADTISYEISDGNGGTAAAEVSVMVNAVNDGPVATNDAVTTDEDTAVTIDVLANDSDVDGDTLTVVSATAANGSVTINPDGTLEYTPNANFNGADTISYAISDGNGGTATAEVAVTVNAVNENPIAADEAVTILEDNVVTINVLANDTDADGDALTTLSASASNGLVTVNANGTLTYEPNANFNGIDTITYEISDGNGGISSATVTVTVLAVNDDPNVLDETATTNTDTAITLDVLANDSDVDGDLLSITSASALNGSVTINPDGTLEYTPNPGFDGKDSVTYVVNDGQGGVSTGSVEVSVNNPPVAAGDVASVDEDGLVTIDVLANDSDLDGDVLSVVSASASNGSVTINPDGTLEYAPNPDFTGQDEIVYEISDGNGGVASATVEVTVNPVNDAPVATDDSASAAQGVPVIIDVLSNDLDVDGDALTVVSATALNGSVTINPDGSLEYTADVGFLGADTISYSISDGNGGAASATVQVFVSPANDAPLALNDSASTLEDTSVTIDVLANDSDPNGDTLTVLSAFASSGSVTVNADGTLDYTPDANFNGTDTISYEISDGNGGTATASVSVTVTPENDAPVAANDSAATDVDTPIDINVLANDSDVDGDTLSVTTASASNGSVTINPDGSLNYVPDAGFTGIDTITYEMTDGNGGLSSAEVAVSVIDPVNNNNPIALSDAATTAENTEVIIDVLANDSDFDGDALTVVAATASHGVVVINSDGTLSYTPDSNFNGTDVINYEVSDGQGGSANAIAVVTVESVNDAPTALNDAVSLDEDTSVVIDVLANDTDVDGDNLTVISAFAGNGIVVVNDDGTLEYTPNTNFNGADTITYEIEDGNGGAATGTVFVTVNAINDDPEAKNDAFSTGVNTAVILDVLTNDSDVDGDALSVISANANNGVVTINADGTLEYVPGLDFNGSDVISYVVSDGQGGVSSASATVVVNTPPVAVDDAVTTDEDTPVTIDVLGNDSDADGNPLIITSAAAANGTVEINLDGTLTYVPDANFFGDDTIVYGISDGQGGSSSAQVAVTVNPDNNGPIAVDDAVTTNEGESIVIDALGNDTDLDDDALSITSASALNGAVTINPDNTLTYTPSTNFNGVDSIQYEIADGRGGVSTATITVTVNSGPIAQDDFATVEAGSNESITSVIFDPDNGLIDRNWLANDFDGEGQALEIVQVDGQALVNGSVTVSGSNGGLFTVNSDGSASFDASSGFESLAEGESTTTQVVYTVSDGNGGLATAVAQVTVNGANDAVLSENDVLTTDEDTAIVLDVLANDSALVAGDSLTVSEVNGSAANVGALIAGSNGGVFTINADGTASFDPNGEYESLTTGEVINTSITYTVVGFGGESSTSTVSVEVVGVNDAPVAGDNAATVDAGSNQVITNLIFDVDAGFVDQNWLANDTDAENQALSITQVNGQDLVNGSITIAGSNGGVFTIQSDGSASFDASTGFEAVADGETALTSVTYTVSDGNGGSATATAQVTVNGLNDAVVSENDVAATDEDTAIVLDILFNDMALINGDTITVSEVAGDSANVGATVAGSNGGLFTINADGTASFDPNGEYEHLTTGELINTSITYTIEGFGGETSTSTVTVQVSGVNDNPVAGDNFATVDAGSNDVITNLIFDIDQGFIDQNWLANDTDAENQVLSISQVDGQDLVNGSITIAGSNGGVFTIQSDGTASFDASTGFETLADGETTVTEVTYTVSDGNGGTATATAQVTVNGLNDAVSTQDDFALTNEDSSVALNVLTNDSALVAGDNISVSAVNGLDLQVGSPVAGSNGGLFTINADGSATFDTNGEFEQLTTGDVITSSVTYTVQGFGGETSTSTVEVQVTGVNDNPVAGDNTATVDAGTNEVITNLIFDIDQGFIDQNLLANDTDAENQTLTITQVNGQELVGGSITIAGSNGGLFTVQSDGSASFDATSGFESLAPGASVVSEILYTVSDGNGGSATATVAVTVQGPNEAPTPQADTAVVDEDSSVVIDVLSNDTDPDGQTLEVVSASAANGTVVVNADSTITYTPNANFNGADTIDYTVSDGQKSADSSVSVTINPVNDAPTAVDDAINVQSNGTSVIEVLTNDSDVDGDGLSITSATALNGTVTINANGTLNYTPDSAATGLDTITYEVSDGLGGTAMATVTVNRLPIALNDFVATPQDTDVSIDVLANDSDVESASLTVQTATAANGTVVINPDGSLFYTPDAGFNGNDAITYTVSDTDGGISTAVVTVAVGDTGNSAPVAGDDFSEVDAGTNSVITNLIFDINNGFVDQNFLANDVDADGDALTLTEVNGQSLVNGSITIAGSNGGVFTIYSDGEASFDASTGFESLAVGETATSSVTYSVSDGKGGFDTATAQVTVNGANDAVVSVDDSAATDEDSVIALDILGNDSALISGDTITVSAVDGVGANVGVGVVGSNGGVFTINSDGTATFDANGDFESLTTGDAVTTSVTYTIQGFGGETSTSTVSVEVSGINDDPVAGDNFAEVDAGDNQVITNLIFDVNLGFVDQNWLENDTDAEGQSLSITQVDGQDLVNGSIVIAGSNGGVFTIASDGEASFDASTGFEALALGESTTTQVIYTVSDGNGGTATATAQVTVNGLNDAVESQNDFDTVDEDSSIVLDILGNDTALIAGDTLSVSAVEGNSANVGTSVAGSNGGVFTINADGSATFDANGDFEQLTTGEAVNTSVTYTVQGFGGETSTSTVTVQVTGVNDAPVAGDNAATVEAGTNQVITNLIFDPQLGIVDQNWLENDTDAENQVLSITQVNGQDLVGGTIVISGSNGGGFTIQSDGEASFDASSGFEALAPGDTAVTQVTYTVSDGNGGTATATVDVTVNGVNDAPDAMDDSATTSEVDAITIDLLANDTDIDGQAITISNIDTTTLSGQIIDNGDGTVTYDANGQFDALEDGESAVDWFEYTIDDGFGGFDTAQVQLTILGSTANAPSTPPPAPAADESNDSATPPEDIA